MNSLWPETDAQRLKTRREEVGLDAAALAKLFAISLAQLRELEEGGQECFYSPVIKAQVGSKLLRFLDADGVDATLIPQPVEQTHPNSEWQKCSAALELEKVSALAHRNLDPSFIQRIGGAFILIWQERAALAVFVLLVLSVLLLVPILKDMRPAASNRPVQASLVETASIAVPAPQTKMEGTDWTHPKAVEAMGLQVATAAPATRSDRDCEWQDQETAIESLQAVKSSDYVHLVASKDIVVCVLDSRSRLTRLLLTAGESRSVHWSAPWRLRSVDMATLKIFFQGQRVSLPNLQTIQVRLQAHQAD